MSRRAFERWDWACYVAAGDLTTTQRAVLLVVARHAGEQATGATVSQATIAESVDVVDRSVRRALDRLVELDLLVPEQRPGRTTKYALNLTRTPDTRVQGPRTPASGVNAAHPGHTPDTPRTPVSYEGEGEGKTPLTTDVAEGRGDEESERKPYKFRTRRAA